MAARTIIAQLEIQQPNSVVLSAQGESQICKMCSSFRGERATTGPPGGKEAWSKKDYLGNKPHGK